MVRALVTGGAGFIGSHISRRLIAEGHEVRVLDNLSTGKRENLADIADKISFIEGDITDPKTVADAVDGVTYIFHQAALPSVPRSVKDPVSSNNHNVNGTLNLLVAARDAGVKRIVQAGSSSVYGNSKTQPKVETLPPEPLSPYAVSKAAGEFYGRAFYETYGLEYVSLRYFNVYGPYQDPQSKYAAVIPRFVTALLDGGQPTVFGDGLQSRDFTFVENVVDANLLASTAEGAAGRVFNIGCGGSINLLDMLKLVGEKLGVKVEPIHGDPREGEVKHSSADISAARNILGYEPKVLFPEGLARTIDWFRERHPGS